MEHTTCPHCQHPLSEANTSFCPACGQPLDVPSSLQDGRYELTQCLGRGGMGMVFLAADKRLRADRAIKLMRLPEGLTNSQAEGLRNRLIQEAQAAQALAERTHHVVRVFDVGIHDEDPYLVMEYLKGRTLADLIAQENLGARYACTLALQMIEALRIAHQQNMIHRDLKPDNIMVVQRDGADFCKLLDFGLVKTNDSLVDTQTGVVMGTLSYMAPEQIRGETVGSAADIFAFGGVFYEMLTGVRSNPGKTQSELLAVLLDQGALPVETHNPTLSPNLSELVNRCLDLDAEKRPTADQIYTVLKNEFRQSGALDATLAHESTPEIDTGTQPEPLPARPSSRVWAYIGIPLLCILGIFVLIRGIDTADTTAQDGTAEPATVSIRPTEPVNRAGGADQNVKTDLDTPLEIVQDDRDIQTDSATPGNRTAELPTVLPRNPVARVQTTSDGHISVTEGSTEDVMATLTRWILLNQLREHRREQEWDALSDEVRQGMATILRASRSEWSAPIELKPDEQKALKESLPSARILRGLGTLWNDGQALLFWGRVTCSKLKSNDHLLRANWKNAFSDRTYCKGVKCLGVLRQAVNDARKENVRVELTVNRIDGSGNRSKKKVTCDISRQRRK